MLESWRNHAPKGRESWQPYVEQAKAGMFAAPKKQRCMCQHDLPAQAGAPSDRQI
jgi:hypothetical protein